MLYLVSTPIGNLEDIALRALRVLKEVDLILAEDTRKTGLLLKHFGIKNNLISFYEHNEEKRIPWIIKQLQENKDIALVSNAGTPTISDPGYKLVRACREKNIAVTCVGGTSSLIAALSLSSLPHQRFVFLGYFPRKPSERKRLIERIKDWDLTLVFFESPYRIVSSLEFLAENLGNCQVSLARELTKKFEEVIEGKIEEAIAHLKTAKIRGEFTVIVQRIN